MIIFFIATIRHIVRWKCSVLYKKSLSGAKHKKARAVIELKNAREIKRTQKNEETCCILFSFSKSQATTSLCVSRKTEKRFDCICLYLVLYSSEHMDDDDDDSEDFGDLFLVVACRLQMCTDFNSFKGWEGKLNERKKNSFPFSVLRVFLIFPFIGFSPVASHLIWLSLNLSGEQNMKWKSPLCRFKNLNLSLLVVCKTQKILCKNLNCVNDSVVFWKRCF